MKLLLGFVMVVSTCLADSPPSGFFSDEEMAAKIRMFAMRNGRIGQEAAWLFAQSGGNSNRICGVAENVYRNSSETRIKNTALSFFWRYGGVRQVPFLETCVTNPVGALYAIKILNKIQGFTSNSVVRVAKYHSMTNQTVLATDPDYYSNRGQAIRDLQDDATQPGVTSEVRNYARDYVFSYASNNCYQIYTADRALIRLDPTYKNSKRRLALLRLAQPVVPGPFGPEYVTNAINELVAYPEANLPE